MIKRTILLLVITLIVLIEMCLSVKVYGATLTDAIKVQKKLVDICNSYNKSCSVAIIKDTKPRGYTTYNGQIVFTTGLIDKLNKEQLSSVGLHEVGHNVLNHYSKMEKFLTQNEIPKENDIVAMRHAHEHQADLFAVNYLLNNNMSIALPSALETLIGFKNYNKVTPTHPSYTARVKVINNYINNYNNASGTYNNIRYIRNYYLPYKF